jgi:methionyl-tRNA formyltransferase
MRIVMMGTGTFAEPTFEALLAGHHEVVGLVTQPDRPAGHERGSTRQTGQGMATIARTHGISLLQPESVNTPEGVAGVKGFNADLLVVAAYGQILSKEVLEATRHGGINVHGSLLPKYRGAAPVAWAIYHGETQTGITIIRMTTGLDAGEMLAQQSLEIGADETAGELEARLAPLGAQLAVRVVDQIAEGTARGVAQDKSQVTKAPKLTKELGVIDWNRPAEMVRNHVRAMQPWPTAYTFLHRADHPPQRVILSKIGRVASDTESSSLGSVRSSLVGLWVSTGANGIVEIIELQPAGKRRMSAAEFLRGHPLKSGDYFGAESE